MKRLRPTKRKTPPKVFSVSNSIPFGSVRVVAAQPIRIRLYRSWSRLSAPYGAMLAGPANIAEA